MDVNRHAESYICDRLKDSGLHSMKTRILRWIISQGVTICYENTTNQMLQRLADEVFFALGSEIDKCSLTAVFTYRQSQQMEKYSGQDATCWFHATSDVGTLYAIGVSVEALEYDFGYCVMLFLHELTHIAHGGEHDRGFHDHLDHLISIYNGVTGSDVQNDYYGL